MYLYYRNKRDEFDAHYGQRAQVEVTFSAFKQKLGETIVSRKVDSQVNEILCTASAYNLTILVRQMFECGLLPDCLQQVPPQAPQGLPVGANSWAQEVPDATEELPAVGAMPVAKPRPSVAEPPAPEEV